LENYEVLVHLLEGLAGYIEKKAKFAEEQNNME